MKDEKTKLERYQDMQALVQQEIRTMFPTLYNQEATKYGVAKTPLHEHNGLDSPKIPASNIIPQLRASGSITMATDGERYTLGLTFNPTQVMFYGTATHETGGSIDIRAHIVGTAQLGPSYYFQPESSTSVTTGGPLYNVVQSSSYFLVASTPGTPQVFQRARTLASEGHLISVEDPGGTVVARATIPNLSTGVGAGLTDKGYGPGFVYVDVELETGWEINGNFVVT